MRVCFTTEEHFFRTPDGRFWSPGNTPAYSFFQRYLGVFDEICVIARVADALQPAPAWKRTDGLGVTFGPVPNYLGPMQYARRIRAVNAAVRQAVRPTDALLLRVGSQIASSLEPLLRQGRPFGLEVVGDPYNVFAPGASKHPLRPFWRWWFTRQMRSQCARASAICYVTGKYLQEHYPPSEAAFCTSFQPMELGEEAFVAEPRPVRQHGGPVRVLTIGSLEQPYKGVDVLIDAIAMAIAQGQDLLLTVVGRGRYEEELKQRAALRGIEQRVRFISELTYQQLLAEMDGSQLFVLASRTEGMPRVVIEAMARALPCVASAVGGIPELLAPEDLVMPGDAQGLSRKIVEVVSNPARMETMSATNLIRARDYSTEVIDAKRHTFLSHLHRATQNWLSGQQLYAGELSVAPQADR
jgi:glycosyltransferase involved in cell wall biosynthesis